MSFDRLAPHYRWMEFILAGKKLHRCRAAFLDQIPRPHRILLLGEGHGRALTECRRRFADARITCLDGSQAMLAQARRQLTRRNLSADRVKFLHADALTWTPPAAAYDLLVANFFLDCFRPDQLEQMIPRLAAGATPDANWLIADFQNNDDGWTRARTRLILWSMYVFFRAVTRLPARELTPPDAFLEKAGLVLHHRIESEWGLLHSDWWQRAPSG